MKYKLGKLTHTNDNYGYVENLKVLKLISAGLWRWKRKQKERKYCHSEYKTCTSWYNYLRRRSSHTRSKRLPRGLWGRFERISMLSIHNTAGWKLRYEVHTFWCIFSKLFLWIKNIFQHFHFVLTFMVDVSLKIMASVCVIRASGWVSIPGLVKWRRNA